MGGTPAFKPVMLFGLRGRPGGFALQKGECEQSWLSLLFIGGLRLIALLFFKTRQESMTKVLLFLAQTQSTASTFPGGFGALMQFIPLILMLGAMYFLLIAPQRKKQKEHEKMLKTLKAGDEIITTGGLYATITTVRDDCFVVRIGENKVGLRKGFINQLVKRGDAA